MYFRVLKNMSDDQLKDSIVLLAQFSADAISVIKKVDVPISKGSKVENLWQKLSEIDFLPNLPEERFRVSLIRNGRFAATLAKNSVLSDSQVIRFDVIPEDQLRDDIILL
jgi:hypothetical protein